jgi:hypothetical protein
VPEVREFQRKQLELALHIRDPERNPPPPGIEDRRLAVYRELFFNNLNTLLGRTFPVLRAVLGDGGWRALVREFMIRHRAHTPYFLELPRELVDYLAARPEDPTLPFLAELAHYEWVELALSVATESDDPSAIDPDGDLLAGVPVKSALAWPLTYRFPVHRISKDFRPTQPPAQPSCLVVHRRPDDEPAFMELNAVTAALLGRIADNQGGSSGRELLLALAADVGYGDSAAFVEHGRQALDELRDKGILLGTRRAA